MIMVNCQVRLTHKSTNLFKASRVRANIERCKILLKKVPQRYWLEFNKEWPWQRYELISLTCYWFFLSSTYLLVSSGRSCISWQSTLRKCCVIQEIFYQLMWKKRQAQYWWSCLFDSTTESWKIIVRNWDHILPRFTFSLEIVLCLISPIFRDI